MCTLAIPVDHVACVSTRRKSSEGPPSGSRGAGCAYGDEIECRYDEKRRPVSILCVRPLEDEETEMSMGGPRYAMSETRQDRGDGVIRVVRARENNLRNVTIEIPKKRITVFTGVSGSGKSSLVFDTIAAESQRQLNETFPSFVRNRLPHYGQPDVDALENLSPAVIVDQKRIGGNARSTVGTATDIFALLRLLFSRIGQPSVGESSVFSFNHPEGMCLTCLGLGTVVAVD